MQEEGARVYQIISICDVCSCWFNSSFTLNFILECGVNSSQVNSCTVTGNVEGKKKNSTPPQHWLISKLGVLSTWNSSGDNYIYDSQTLCTACEQGLGAVLVNPGLLWSDWVKSRLELGVALWIFWRNEGSWRITLVSGDWFLNCLYCLLNLRRWHTLSKRRRHGRWQQCALWLCWCLWLWSVSSILWARWEC